MTIEGRSVMLTGDEVATAIDAYLTAHNVCVSGPRTITVRNRDCNQLALLPIQHAAEVYVDPSGRLVDNR